MGIEVEVLADSISGKVRLSTVRVRCHRFVQAQLNTHRAFSRSSASSRAIPVAKQLKRLLDDPALPVAYEYNQPGMQASLPLSESDEAEAEAIILDMMNACVEGVSKLSQLGPISDRTGEPLGLHKQWANRYLEPWMWQEIIISSTEWENFFNLRNDDAQPEMRIPAQMIKAALEAAPPPVHLRPGEWHMPFIHDWERQDVSPDMLRLVSAARSARVSYMNHLGVRDLMDDLRLFRDLVSNGHLSPLEHVASPLDLPVTSNFKDPWVQLRHASSADTLIALAETHMKSRRN